MHWSFATGKQDTGMVVLCLILVKVCWIGGGVHLITQHTFLWNGCKIYLVFKVHPPVIIIESHFIYCCYYLKFTNNDNWITFIYCYFNLGARMIHKKKVYQNYKWATPGNYKSLLQICYRSTNCCSEYIKIIKWLILENVQLLLCNQ
jgi:hypothetical protein